MKQIFVKESEYRDYEFSITSNNRISEFWKNICNNLPLNLFNEIRNKRTDLILDPNTNNISGVIVYRFATKEASVELNNFLKDYLIFVEHDTSKIKEWRKDVINWLLDSKKLKDQIIR